jgi:hypothetical protein
MAAAKKGVSDGDGVTDPVDQKRYPDRPYGEAITPAHKEFLEKELGVKIGKDTESESGVVTE